MNILEAFVKIGADTSDLDKSVDGLDSSLGSKLGSAASKAAGLAAAGLAAASTAVVAFGKSAVDAGMSFDQSMSNVAAISGATGDDFEALRNKAQEMGSTTKFSATEAADAFSYMAMAGWKTDDMLNGITGIMNLAAASGEDLALTSDIVTDALTGFGLSAQDSGHFADILAAASSNANTNVALMGETFKYVAPVAGALGVSAEDTAEAVGLMANAGIKGSQAGTSLRSILTRLSTDAGASSKSLGALGVLTEELGVDFYDAEGNVRDFGDILDDARVQWKTLGAEDAATFAKKIAGQEGISAWLALMNAAPEDVEKLRSSIVDCDGAALDMATTMNDNLAGDITIFRSALEGAQIAVSDQLTPTLREFVQVGTQGLSDITTAFKEGGLEAAMGALGEWLSTALSKVIELIPQVVEAGAQVLTALVNGISQNIPQISQAAVTVITTLANVMTNNLPQILSAGINMISSLVSGIGQALPTLIPASVEATIEFVNGLLDNIDQLVDAGLQLLTGLATGIVNAIPIIIEKVPEIITKLIAAFTENYPKIVETGVTLFLKLIENLPQIISAIIEALPQIITGIVNFFIEAGPKMIQIGADLLMGIIKGITNTVASVIESIKNFATSIIDSIKGFFGIHSPSTVFEEIGGNLISGLLKGIENIWKNVTKFFSDAVEFIGGAFKAVPEKLKTAGKNIINGLQNGASSVWNGVTKFFGDAKDTISKAFDKVPETLKSVGKNIGSKFHNGVSDTWKNVTKFFGDAKDGIAKMFDKVPDSLKTVGKNIVTGLQNGLADKVSDVSKALGDIGSSLSNWMQGLNNTYESMKTIGGNLMTGLANGITSAASKAWEAATSAASSLVNGVESLFGVSSPSKVFAQIGEYLDEGLAKGITGRSGIVTDAMDALSSDLIADASASVGSVSAAGAGREITVQRYSNDNRNLTVILELNKTQFAKAVYQLNNEETQRVGARLAGGYA